MSSRCLLGIQRRDVEEAVSHLQFQEEVLETGPGHEPHVDGVESHGLNALL